MKVIVQNNQIEKDGVKESEGFKAPANAGSSTGEGRFASRSAGNLPVPTPS
jgi:hypothetical protein